MRYLVLIISILFLCSCSKSYTIKLEDYNYLEEDSLRFIRTNNETSILINKDSEYYLLLLNKPNINIDVDYLIKYKSTNNKKIKSKEEYILKDNLVLDDVIFKLNDKIEIQLNNNNFCIYIKNINQDNFSTCDFIYLYNPDYNFYITLNNNIKVLFYNSYNRFNYKFMEHLAFVWIDTYIISPTDYTTVTISNDSFTIKQDKIRGKTIHKK